LPKQRTIAGLGWNPDHPDPRDRQYALEECILTRPQLPRKVEPLTDKVAVPRWNQGQLGSCTGHGIARVLAYEARRQGESLDLAPGRMDNNTAGQAGYSRLFIYYGERAIEGTVNSDSGGQIRDGIKVIASEGAPPESEWPYDIAKFTDRPPARAFEDATSHEAIQYRRVVPDGPGAPVHTALANGLPVVFGFVVPQYMMDGSWDPTSEALPLPGPSDQFVGGHCVVATGYDLDRHLFVIDNSWGEDWGLAGRFNMDERWFDRDLGLVSDAWVVERVK